MNVHPLSPDDEVITLLCAHLDARGRDDARARPLTLRDWNPLAQKIARSTLKTPGALLGRSSVELAATLELAPDEATRCAELLDRGAQLAVERERLAARGIGIVTRADRARYPERLRRKLGQAAPALFFYSGDLSLAARSGLAVHGSRKVDEAGREFADQIGRQAACSGLALVSGWADGVDLVATLAALEADGPAIGVPAHSLERALAKVEPRAAVAEGKLLLLTPYHPRAPFSVGAAMGRNKLIYALADFALIVAATRAKGGTWAGAVEALKNKWTPVFIREASDEPSGNAALRELGGRPFPSDLAALDESLAAFLVRESTRDEASAASGPPFPRGEGGEGARSGLSSDPRAEDRARTDSCDSVPNDSDESDETARLLAFLEMPHGEEEIAAHLGVGRGLARDILKEHVAAGRVNRLDRPVRYQRPQPDLWGNPKSEG